MNNQNHQFENDIEQLGSMVESEMRKTVPTIRQQPAFDHHPEVDDVGRLSSEALAMSYEASAKQIEAMGASLVTEIKEMEMVTLSMVKEAERVKAEYEEAVKQCAAAAEVYRGQAKELFESIQRRAIIAAKVRKTATDMIEEVKGATNG